jgi:mannan endo-1,4-beta-mannosidase
MARVRLGLWLALAGSVACSPALPSRAPRPLEPSATFEVDGQPLCFTGSSNYYAIYKPKPVVDDLFRAARELKLRVLRVWGMLDRGSLDGAVPNVDGAGEKDGVYFQYWDPETLRPAYNDGENGLVRLDYVLAAAAEHDIKLIVVLINNWPAFGGIDQYLTWYGRGEHHEFFSAPELKQAYRNWVEHVLTRVNTVNGRRYKDDPVVFAWELANEPRCKSGSSFDSNTGWDTSTITSWADEMSSFVKSLDPNHLVSVGDEGFLNGGGQHWAYRAHVGVDHAALTALPHVDFGTFHLYPDDWGTAAGFAEQWIADHLDLARRLGKPSLLEEYGIKAARGVDQRLASYRRYNDVLLERGGSASMPWMLAGSDGNARYPDYDGFTFYRDDAIGKLLASYAERFHDAPACRQERRALRRPASPYVRVLR